MLDNYLAKTETVQQFKKKLFLGTKK